VFGAAGTDLGYRILVTDTAAGESREYRNEPGSPSRALTDTAAFALPCTEGGGAAVASAGSPHRETTRRPFEVQPVAAVEAAARPGAPGSVEAGDGCGVAGEGFHCFHHGRFRMDVSWTLPDGRTGPGYRVPRVATESSGLFIFFDRSNWEVLARVLDGCSYNGRYWVLAAYATDLGLDITVTDRETGESKLYRKVPGPGGEAIVDIGAFEGACREPSR